MKPYSNPVINKHDPAKWYIEFHYAVPEELREQYTRGTKRFRKYGDINYYEGEAREKNAQKLCEDWLFALDRIGYNPFEHDQHYFDHLTNKRDQVQQRRAEIEMKQVAEPIKTASELRKETSIRKAFDLYLEHKESTLDNGNSFSTYKGTIKWLTTYFEANGRMGDSVDSITHLEIGAAILFAKESRKWGNSTYNNEITCVMIVFNWLENEEYMTKNPSRGKLKKLKVKVTKHKWYDKETAKAVKKALITAGPWPVYRACQFTYHICIRSKIELMKLKVGDIDRVLKRVHFSAELSKDNREHYRDYSAEFEKVIDEMELSSYPSHFYVFGKGGVPSDKPCHKDFLAEQFKITRDQLGLSSLYSIYSWKHTRACHEAMKKTDPYTIMHMFRHKDLEITQKYMRDFDINLSYPPEDLTF